MIGIGSVFSAGAFNHLDQIPLNPPHPEIIPDFAERHRAAILVNVILVLWVVLAVFLVLKSRRPRPESIEISTRRELEALIKRSDDGITLSTISRILRLYLAMVLGLPAEETTTTDLCHALTGNENLGPELARLLSEFFRRLDEMKFAPDILPSGAEARRALELFEAVERRRAALQEAALRKPPVYS